MFRGDPAGRGFPDPIYFVKVLTGADEMDSSWFVNGIKVPTNLRDR